MNYFSKENLIDRKEGNYRTRREKNSGSIFSSLKQKIIQMSNMRNGRLFAYFLTLFMIISLVTAVDRNIETKIYDFDDEMFYEGGSFRSLAGTFDVSQSTVTLSTSSATSSSSVTITVQAKDNTGANLSVGGETLVATITNECTLSGYTCTVNNGASNTLATSIVGKMTDNGNGVYTYTFTLESRKGKVSVKITQLTSNTSIPAYWYQNNAFTSPVFKQNTTSTVAFSGTPSSLVSSTSMSVIMSGIMMSTTTKTVNFVVRSANCQSTLTLNGVDLYTDLTTNGGSTKSYTSSFTSYSIVPFTFKSKCSGSSTTVYVNTDLSGSSTAFPTSINYAASVVSGAVKNITVSCATNYSPATSGDTDV